ncbi:hypothetical protein DFH07DRAFT_122666 [Mycena maculata]|uniref:Uncharacterized protein n=1 Tax=Mycena maculata TaxID=230809 RepID=A0AAD7JY71_9AGAR|nr:hypothetical protein DFH07DRAFT_122666 [Mycena maculata]
MYRAPSPFSQEQNQRTQPYSGQIAPGQVTYTTSTGPDGRVVYHPFRAVAASYQTPNGIVSGIQWVPAEATLVLPPGAQPANSEFAASWSRGAISKDEQKALKEWQRDEEKRRKKEEKEAKRQREKEQQRSGQAYGDADNELRKARERDAEAMAARQRRASFNQGAASNTMAFPATGGASGGYPTASGYPAANPGYPATPYTAGFNGVPVASGYDQRDRKYSTGAGLTSAGLSDLDRQFGDLSLDRNQEYGSQAGGLSRPRTYQADSERSRKASSSFGDRPAYNTTGSYPSGAYPTTAYSAQAPGTQYPSSQYSTSPNMRPGESPQVPYVSSAYGANASSAYGGNSSSAYGGNYPAAGPPMVRPTTPYAGQVGGGQVYPPGHIMEGKPITRSTTPIPGAGGVPPGLGASYPAGQAPFPTGMQMPDPNAADQGQLAAPDGFSRPINAAQAYTPFETMKIQDMDDLIQNAPRMPAVLQPHDVYPSDWNRMMQDLCLAWTGRLPAPGRTQKKTTLAADLIDLWNVSFFFPRGVEVVLYKGRERRSGPSAGAVDIQLPTYGDRDDASSSSSSSSEDSDSDGGGGRYPQAGYMYGQQPFAPGQGSMAEVLEQRRRRREVRAEKKRRRKEKKARRKAKAREKKYALYLTCVPNGGPAAVGGSGMPGGMGMGTGMMPSAAGMSGSGYGGPGMAPNPTGGAGYGGPGMMPNSMGGAGYGAVAGGMPMMPGQPGGY